MLLELDASALLSLLLGGMIGAAIMVPIVRAIRRRTLASTPQRAVAGAPLFRPVRGGYDVRCVDDFLDGLALFPVTEEGRAQALASLHTARFPRATRHLGYAPHDVDAYLTQEARRLAGPATPDANPHERAPDGCS